MSTRKQNVSWNCPLQTIQEYKTKLLTFPNFLSVFHINYNKKNKTRGWVDSLAVLTDISKKTALRGGGRLQAGQRRTNQALSAPFGISHTYTDDRSESCTRLRTHVHTQTHSTMFLSFHSEATGLLDRCQQLIVQLVVALVGRNVDPIEAGRKQKERSWSYERLKSTRHTHVCVCVCGLCTPGVGFGQIVGVGIDLVNGEESGSSSTCRTNTKCPSGSF